VPPAPPPPAAPPAIGQPHRPLLLGPGGPSSPPWPATAAPAPPPTAQSPAPDTAGQHDCRTAARECGRPGSANRRSGGCTARGRRASASSYMGGPCPIPSRAGWRSPRAGGCSGRSPGVTAVGLVARGPTNSPSGGHGQVGAASRFHRTPPRSDRPGTVRTRPPTRKAQRPSHALPWRSRTPVVSCPARSCGSEGVVGRCHPQRSNSTAKPTLDHPAALRQGLGRMSAWSPHTTTVKNDGSLRPHPYQRSTANRRAMQRSPRSHGSVVPQG
jgi:hypothetical protein